MREGVDFALFSADSLVQVAGSTGAVLFSFVSSGPDVSGTGTFAFPPEGRILLFQPRKHPSLTSTCSMRKVRNLEERTTCPCHIHSPRLKKPPSL